ncbi:MAG: MATE family efflux transporter [Candidatus Omnitrophica bacterium]|nr:MATE family efflux transporter [Candidatus Omnitrophota bacterium]
MSSLPKEHPKGSIKEMAVIALPMVVSCGCDTVMIFTDRLFLSKLGPEQMNAAMGGGLTVFMMMSFFIGIIGYATALVAQYLGAGRREKCAVVLAQALLLALLAYVPILFCRPLAHALFSFMGVSSAQMTPQKLYFDILLLGTIISLERVCLASFFSGIGRTGIVMTASCTAMFINLVLNYILIYGKCGFPALGIAGSAYGTILGGLSGLLVLAGGLFTKKNIVEFGLKTAFRFDRDVMSRLLRFGTPTGLEMFLNIMAFNAMVLIFHSRGLVTATAATIVLNWDLVSFVPLIGIEVGVISLVGRYMGAGDPDNAHRATMAGFKIGLMYSAVILVLFFCFPAYLVKIFQPAASGEVFAAAAPLAIDMVRLASIYVLVEAMFVVFIGALRGAGDTFWAMAISVSLHWIMVGILFVLLRVMGVSPLVGWSAVVFLFFVFSFIAFFRYHSGKWRKIKVVDCPSTVISPDGLNEPPALS